VEQAKNIKIHLMRSASAVDLKLCLKTNCRSRSRGRCKGNGL
jgi:hypothetical protein